MPSLSAQIFLASAFTMSALAASADTPSKLSAQSLATIGEDQSNSLSQLSAVSDDKGLRGILFKTIKGTSPGDDPLTKFTMSQMTSAKGIVLVKQQGYDAIILKAKSAAGAKYSVVVSYLKNALTSDYGTCSLALEKGDDGAWELKNDKTGAKISKILVKTWNLGITELDGACASETAN